MKPLDIGISRPAKVAPMRQPRLTASTCREAAEAVTFFARDDEIVRPSSSHTSLGAAGEPTRTAGPLESATSLDVLVRVFGTSTGSHAVGLFVAGEGPAPVPEPGEDPAPVPEPGTLALLGSGLALLARARRRLPPPPA
jgi:hypothetical protein